MGDKPITLSFDEGRLGAEPECNSAGAGYRLEAGRLVLTGDLEQTLMACADEQLMVQDEWFAKLLGARPELVLAGSGIELRTADTVPRGTDREVADPDRSCESAPRTNGRASIHRPAWVRRGPPRRLGRSPSRLRRQQYCRRRLRRAGALRPPAA